MEGKRILLLGGAGLLSGAAREAFLAAGHEVTALTRGRRPVPPHPRLTLLRADRRDPGALAAALKGGSYCLTVDFLAYTGDDLAALFAVPGFDPGRLVMISTGQVCLVTENRRQPYREGDSEAPPVPEPPRGTRDWREWEYGMGKREAEAALRRLAGERGLAALALRLPVIQGEEDGQASRRLWAWLQRMGDGGPVLLPEGGVQPVRFLYAGDAAAALLRLAGLRQWPALPALNLAQPGENTLKEFLEMAAGCAGLKPEFVPVGAGELAEAGLADTCAPYWGRWCSRLDPAAAFALGFAARGPEAYLPSVVAAHLRGPRPVPHEGYARRAEELALAAKLSGRR